MSSTIDCYNKYARTFSESTRDVIFTDIQDRFLSLLPPGGSTITAKKAGYMSRP